MQLTEIELNHIGQQIEYVRDGSHLVKYSYPEKYFNETGELVNSGNRWHHFIAEPKGAIVGLAVSRPVDDSEQPKKQTVVQRTALNSMDDQPGNRHFYTAITQAIELLSVQGSADENIYFVNNPSLKLRALAAKIKGQQHFVILPNVWQPASDIAHIIGFAEFKKFLQNSKNHQPTIFPPHPDEVATAPKP